MNICTHRARTRARNLNHELTTTNFKNGWQKPDRNLLKLSINLLKKNQNKSNMRCMLKGSSVADRLLSNVMVKGY